MVVTRQFGPVIDEFGDGWAIAFYEDLMFSC